MWNASFPSRIVCVCVYELWKECGKCLYSGIAYLTLIYFCEGFLGNFEGFLGKKEKRKPNKRKMEVPENYG